MGKPVLVVGNEPAIAAVVVGVARAMGFDADREHDRGRRDRAPGARRSSRSSSSISGLPAGEGAAVIMKARACRPAVTALALTAHGSVAGAVEALRAGAADVVAKPFHTSALEDAITRVTVRARRRAADTAGVAVIGDHPAMRLVLDRVDQIADTDAERADSRRDRHRQGGHRAADPRRQRAPHRSVRRGQHGRHPGVAGRGRAVRTRARRLHRRRQGAHRAHGGGARRDAVPRRDRRDAEEPAGEAAARAAGRRGDAGRRRLADPRRRARRGRHAPRPRGA